MDNLTNKKCIGLKDGLKLIKKEDYSNYLKQVPGWEIENCRINKKWSFKNHYQAISFVNAVAWISHTENHHPNITVGFKDVSVEYWTHDVNGISINDFICAAKVDLLSVD